MPNVILMDGFDVYNIAATNTTDPGIHGKWVTTSAYSGITGRYGGQAISFDASIFNRNLIGFFEKNSSDSSFYSTITASFAFRMTAIEGISGESIVEFHHQGEHQCGVGFNAIGGIITKRGGTVTATSLPNLVKAMVWHYIEIETVINSGSGRMTVFLDGVNVLEYTGNTQNIGPYAANGIRFNNMRDITWHLDDLNVVDVASRIGERRVETLRVNGDVSGNAWIPAVTGPGYDMLDDILVDMNTYVSSNTVGAKDMYNLSNLSTNPTTIDAVQLFVWAQKTDSDTRTMTTQMKSGSIETTSTPYNIPSDSIPLTRIANKDPNGNIAWTTAAVNALQVGFRINS